MNDSLSSLDAFKNSEISLNFFGLIILNASSSRFLFMYSKPKRFANGAYISKTSLVILFCSNSGRAPRVNRLVSLDASLTKITRGAYNEVSKIFLTISASAFLFFSRKTRS